MSSACDSRDFKSPGTAPKPVPLGYSGRVLYTFLPHEKEQTEIFVSEGDIVKLLYKVGTWVYVTTQDGDSGYIPLEFCTAIETASSGENRFSIESNTLSSDNTRSVVSITCKHGTVKDSSIGSQINEDQPDVYSFEDKVACDSFGTSEEDIITKFDKVPQEIYISKEASNRGVQTSVPTLSLKCGEVSKVQDTIIPKCDICGNFIARLPSEVQRLIIANRGKADFESRKLLKETQGNSIEGLNSCLNTVPPIVRDESYGKGINQIGSFETHGRTENILDKLRVNCEQCNALKIFLQLQSENSMSSVYTNIRDLQLHAVSDSDSEGDVVGNDDGIANKTPKGACLEQGHGENGSVSDDGEGDTPPPPLPTSSPPPLLISDTEQGSGDAEMERQNKDEASVAKGKHLGAINRAPGTRMLPVVPKYDSKMAWNDPKSYHSVFEAELDCKNYFDPLLVSDMGNPDEDFMRHGSRTTNGFASSEGSVESSEPDKFLGADGKLYDSESDLCVKRVSVSSYESSDEGARPLSGLSEVASPTPKSPDMRSVDLIGAFSSVSINDQDIHVPSTSQSTNGSSSIQTLQSTSSSLVDDVRARKNSKSASDVQAKTSELDKNDSGAKSDGSLKVSHNDANFSRTLPPTPKPVDFRNNLVILGNRPKIQTLPNKLMVSPAVRTRQHTTTAMVSSVGASKKEEEPRTKIRPSIITIAPPLGNQIVVKRTQPFAPIRTNADRQDEKDIKKTLHEHSMTLPRRTSQMPMRAHHSIHAEAGKDSRMMKTTGRTILVKKHNKQIWRPPTGSPEGGETQRPFSPFGGTLPPSKIGSKKKVVEVFV